MGRKGNDGVAPLLSDAPAAEPSAKTAASGDKDKPLVEAELEHTAAESTGIVSEVEEGTGQCDASWDKAMSESTADILGALSLVGGERGPNSVETITKLQREKCAFRNCAFEKLQNNSVVFNTTAIYRISA